MARQQDPPPLGSLVVEGGEPVAESSFVGPPVAMKEGRGSLRGTPWDLGRSSKVLLETQPPGPSRKRGTKARRRSGGRRGRGWRGPRRRRAGAGGPPPAARGSAAEPSAAARRAAGRG